MCLHNDTIEDFTTGDVICTKCGVIMDKILIDPNQVKPRTNLCVESYTLNDATFNNNNIRLSVIDFVDSIHIHRSFVDEILKNVIILQKSFVYSPLSMLIAASCYTVLNKNCCSISLSKFEKYACKNNKDRKLLFKMIVTLGQSNTISNQAQNLVETSLHGIFCSFQEIETIKKNIVRLNCTYCSHNPLTVAASHTFLTLKRRKVPLTITFISSHMGISKNSIYSFIDPKKHSCVKDWDYVYEQLSCGKKISEG